jgi:hypothetical protein
MRFAKYFLDQSIEGIEKSTEELSGSGEFVFFLKPRS